MRLIYHRGLVNHGSKTYKSRNGLIPLHNRRILSKKCIPCRRLNMSIVQRSENHLVKLSLLLLVILIHPDFRAISRCIFFIPISLFNFWEFELFNIFANLVSKIHIKWLDRLINSLTWLRGSSNLGHWNRRRVQNLIQPIKPRASYLISYLVWALACLEVGSEPRQLKPATLLTRNEFLQICVQFQSPSVLLVLEGTLIDSLQILPHVNAGRIILCFSCISQPTNLFY